LETRAKDAKLLAKKAEAAAAQASKGENPEKEVESFLVSVVTSVPTPARRHKQGMPCAVRYRWKPKVFS
jgi:hypothetical protein